MNLLLSISLTMIVSLLAIGCSFSVASHPPGQRFYSHFDQLKTLLNDDVDFLHHQASEYPDHHHSDYTFTSAATLKPRRENYDIPTGTEKSVSLFQNPIPARNYFPAQAELYCFGKGCTGFHFTSPLTIIINDADHILTFDQLSLTSPDGNTLKGNISFNIANKLNPALIENNILMTTHDISLAITGEGSTTFDRSSDGHPGFAAFQFRDQEHDITLDLVSLF